MEGYGQHALRDFRGLKVSQDAGGCEEFGLHRVTLARDDRGNIAHAIQAEPGTIGGGGNSGFQALNLAIQFGARRILLLGYDMHGGHWHGDHPAGMAQPKDDTMARWRRAFQANAPLIAAMGVEVINCTPGSALTCFGDGNGKALDY